MPVYNDIEVPLPPVDGNEYLFKNDTWVPAEITGNKVTVDSAVAGYRPNSYLYGTGGDLKLTRSTQVAVTGFDDNGVGQVDTSLGYKLILGAGRWLIYAGHSKTYPWRGKQTLQNIRVGQGDDFYYTYESYWEQLGEPHSCNMLSVNLSGSTSVYLYSQTKSQYGLSNSSHPATGCGTFGALRLVD